ncbi:MAG TPA: hypothetical protein VHM91_16675, partial [Verrucomicrobiales bacterium]|nr:hypothetical protein [Verrucomicrobiales bacterium]
DTFGFSTKITGNGIVGPGWTTADVNPPAGNTAAGSYGATVVWTGFPVGAPKSVTIADSATPSMNATVTVNPPVVLGVNELGTPGSLIAGDGSVLTGWVLDETAMTATLENQTAQTDHVINSSTIDLSSTGFVLFTGDLDAVSGPSSGFEAADFFSLDLIIDGAAPVSALGSSNDVDLDGKLSGAAAGAGTELQDTAVPGITKSFHFAYLIPATANSLQIRLTGDNNSTSEKYLVKNMKLSTAPALLFAQQTAPIVTLDNKGTVNPLDDEFLAQVAIQAANLGASTGWHSDETPARTGLYAAANPVTFGPYPHSAGARTVTLIDNLNPLIVSQPLTFLPPPAPALTVSAPVNIQRHENGPGAEDDTVSFDVSISGTRGGPGWSSAATTPSGGAFSATPVTLTFQVPPTGTSLPVTITDASYPTTSQTVTVTFPGRYILGRLDLGGGLLSLASDLATTPPALWVNNATTRTLTMSAGTTVDSIVTSELIDLSNTGDVQFSAKMHLRETSTGSNIENTDRFKAELIIDGVAQNLVTAWDTGDGSSAVTVGAN